MVCSKCAARIKPTVLATPGVKSKKDIYYGSAASSSADKARKSATLGNSGVTKSKLLGKGAKNPYATYSASCEKCKTKVEQGKKFCQSCAYKENACAMCGKSMTKDTAKGAGGIVQGQRFSAK